MLLLAVPPPVFADELSGELPKSTRDILDESGTDLSDAARWRFSDLCDTVGAWAAEGLQPALHLAAQSARYLLLAGLLGLLGLLRAGADAALRQRAAAACAKSCHNG